ncbi:MAG: DUF4197 domain-containing protein [Acidobacteria bacterium]|nr:DUF4197 domain-containing protein [Acidobacteriota bacterium]
MKTRRSQLLLLCAGLPLQAQLKDIFGKFGAKSKAGDKNSLGIKEALSIGLTNAVGFASRPDGFFANTLIKILLPEKLKPVERGLRMVGGAKLIDDFVLGMNRAAEKAAPVAKDIFLDSLKRMSITDAMQLLRGGDTAATDFFRKNTGEPLVKAFRPPITESMESVGAMKAYNDMTARFKQIPFMRADSIDIEGYVTTKAVDGLFLLVGEEEKKIRTNPAAQITPLLKDVFGSLGKR